MIPYLPFLFFCLAFGKASEEIIRPIYIPKQASTSQDDDPSREDTPYCYRFTWLGAKYDNSTFHEVFNKTCLDHFGKNDPTLCVDPMVVTFSGGKPDLNYIREHHFNEATCKLSEDRVCAKYTIYYNGVASHVVRYCTRIDVQSEGPMLSGCLTEKNFSSAYEVCACISRNGKGGICNHSARINSSVFVSLTFSMMSLFLYQYQYMRKP